MVKSKCPTCEQFMTCTTSTDCWCHSWPPLLSPSDSDACLCAKCLQNAILAKAQLMMDDRKHEAIADLGPVQTPQKGLDYTINPAGLLVFTKWYHLRRGTCCGSGCMHCPYGD